MTRKTCSQCGRLKPLTEFYLTGKTTRRTECKACCRRGRKREHNAYSYALGVVRDRHRDEFDQVYVEAKQRAGIA